MVLTWTIESMGSMAQWEHWNEVWLMLRYTISMFFINSLLVMLSFFSLIRLTLILIRNTLFVRAKSTSSDWL